MAGSGAELQYLPSIHVDGVGNLGNFDQISGGDAQATPTKYRPGGMGPQISYVALPEFTDVVCERVYEEARDHSLIGALRPKVGRVRATISMQPLDDEGNAFGKPRVFRGRIDNIMDGNADSTSNAPRKWQLHISTETING